MSGDSASDAKRILDEDVKVLHHMGYAQELARRMGGFSNFAISFSIICILAGGITAFPVAFSAGGPFSVVVGWLVGGVFALIVGLAMAQIASAYPTAGGLYHWASILGGRGYGWVCAWINMLGLVFVVASVNVGVYLLFRDLVLVGVLGMDVSAWGYQEQVIAVSLITLTQALFNHYGIKTTTDVLPKLKAQLAAEPGQYLVAGMAKDPQADIATPVLRCDGRAVAGFLNDRR